MTRELRWGDLLVAGDDRRRKIRARGANGIDGVEVADAGRRLAITFLEHAPAGVAPDNVRIDAPAGSLHVEAVDVDRVTDPDSELEDRLLVQLDRAGSAGRYRLRLVEPGRHGALGTAPLRGLDPRFAEVFFVFDVDAPGRARSGPGAPAPDDGEHVSYLARDYEGLRRLLLDRLAITLPEWTERHVPDVVMTLVELLAYAGDDLSYYQDAVATEAYLQTARQRISIRRHARLVDYRLHDGCNARAWVCVEVDEAVDLQLEHVRFAAGARQYAALVPETLRLRPAHNAIALWTWGEADARLAAGATAAVLVDGAAPDARLALGPGDVLVFEHAEDRARRHAVRLTAVRALTDRLLDQLLLKVSWAAADALPFELAVSASGRPCSHACGNVVLVAHGVPVPREDVVALRLEAPGLSFATSFPDPAAVGRREARRLRGLYAAWREEVDEWRRLARHGTRLSEEQLELLRRQVGAEALDAVGLPTPDGGAGDEARALAVLLARADRLLERRRRRLELLACLAESSGPLDDVLVEELIDDWGDELVAPLAASHPANRGPASRALDQDPRRALPRLRLTAGDKVYRTVPDLLAARPAERAVVAEIDNEGGAHLRLGAPPRAGTPLARYWVGNGTQGNAAAGAIDTLVWLGADGEAPHVRCVRNPLPARGGIDPEDLTAARRAIPGAYLEDQPRALRAADYVRHAVRVSGVRSAAAELRWTGTGVLADVAIIPAQGEDPSRTLLADVKRSLAAVRRVDHRVRARAPRRRPLLLELRVTLAPRAIRDDAGAELAALLGSGTPRALFHPSRLDFGQPVYSSAVIAAVLAVDGVTAVDLRRFGFADEPARAPDLPIPERLAIGPLEVVRLDNDPLLPARGTAIVVLEGGR